VGRNALVSKNTAPLTSEGLFRLVTDEVFRDGVLDSRENHVLHVLSRFLRLEELQAKEIAAASRHAYREQQLPSGGAMKPIELYSRALTAILADGRVDELERRLLFGLGKLLEISPEDHARALKLAQGNTPRPSSPLSLQEVTALANASIRLAGDLQDDVPSEAQRAEAAAILKLLLPCLPLGEEFHNSLACIGGNLAGVLAGDEDLPLVAAYLEATCKGRDIWRSRPEVYLVALQTAASQRLPERYPEAVKVLQVAERLARIEPQENYRMRTWAELLRLLGMFAHPYKTRQRLDPLLDAFHRIPEHFRASVASIQAGLFTDMVFLGLKHGHPDRAHEGLQHLEQMSYQRTNLGVAQKHCRALCCLIEVVAQLQSIEAPDRREDFSSLRGVFPSLTTLVERHQKDPTIARLVVAMAPFGLRCLQAMGDPPGEMSFRRLLADLVEVHSELKDSPRASGYPSPQG
jgi:hypothetical protein